MSRMQSGQRCYREVSRVVRLQIYDNPAQMGTIILLGCAGVIVPIDRKSEKGEITNLLQR